MSEYLWPPELIPTKSEFHLLDSAGRFASPLTGFTHRTARPGERLRVTLTLGKERLRPRALMQSLFARMRGATNELWLHDHTHTVQGSWAHVDLITDNHFASVSGLTAGSRFTIAATEQGLRAKRSMNDFADSPLFRNTNALTVTAYSAYAFRALAIAGPRVRTTLRMDAGSTAFGTEFASVGGYAAGMLALPFVPLSTSLYVALTEAVIAGAVAGEITEVPYWSVARCGLIDAEANAVTYSDQLDNAAWTKEALTATANAAVAPDGSTTAENLVETTANSTHEIFRATTPVRTSQAEDVLAFGYFRRNLGTRNIQIRVGSSSVNYSRCDFDLGTGTAGSVTNVGTATNGRAFIFDAGNSYYYCVVIARVAASAEIYHAHLFVNGGSTSYVGSTSQSLYAWRLGCARGSVPSKPAQTVATAYASGPDDRALAGGIPTKGWDASVTESLKVGSLISVGGQMTFLTAPLETDALGRATLYTAPGLREPYADNTPIIVVKPMGKFFQERNENGWQTNPPGFQSDAELTLVEA